MLYQTNHIVIFNWYFVEYFYIYVCLLFFSTKFIFFITKHIFPAFLLTCVNITQKFCRFWDTDIFCNISKKYCWVFTYIYISFNNNFIVSRTQKFCRFWDTDIFCNIGKKYCSLLIVNTTIQIMCYINKKTLTKKFCFLNKKISVSQKRQKYRLH